MSTRPNMIFEDFLKTAAATATASMTSVRPDRAGDSMQRLRTGSSSPTWSAPNPSQATPSANPIAAQKIAPPPPVQ